jgi:hypothetical protein
MPDTYPPHEICDIPSPANRLIQIPLPHPVDDFSRYREYSKTKKQNGGQKSHPPEFGRTVLDRSNNVFRNLVIAFIA